MSDLEKWLNEKGLREKLCKDCKHSELRTKFHPWKRTVLWCYKKDDFFELQYYDIRACELFESKEREEK